MNNQPPGAALKALHKPHTIVCEVCGKTKSVLGNAKTCSTACRSKAYRTRKQNLENNMKFFNSVINDNDPAGSHFFDPFYTGEKALIDKDSLLDFIEFGFESVAEETDYQSKPTSRALNAVRALKKLQNDKEYADKFINHWFEYLKSELKTA